MSSVAARFFPPQTSGLGVTVGQSGTPFRIDHDEVFNQTTHLQYQTPWKRGPWIGFNWRYDSGLVAGAVPCYGVSAYNDCPTSTTLNGQPAVDLSGLTADQEFQAGLFCGSVKSSPFTPLPSPCLASQFGSNLVQVPAPGTQNDDHHPARVASRSLFDLCLLYTSLYRSVTVRRRRASAQHWLHAHIELLRPDSSGSVTVLRLPGSAQHLVFVPRPYRRERAGDVHSGQHHQAQLDVQSGNSR